MLRVLQRSKSTSEVLNPQKRWEHWTVRNFSVNCGVQYGRDDINSPFPEKYTTNVEKGWYDWWKSEGFFKPKVHKRKSPGKQAPFSMVLPPPNVTGALHIGHALTTCVQDSLVRYHRMRGCETVWVPGSDHAGIATQIVVEKQLAAKDGVSRHDLGRELFVQKVKEWKEEKGNVILKQLEHLGASLDWSRTQFTLSPEYTRSVNQAFIKLFNAGIIYRKKSLINWSCVLQSTISDIEVNHVDVEKRTDFHIPGFSEPVEFGVMTDIAYKVSDSCYEVVISTTRPETMLGDTAVAVNPNDERYMHLIGRTVWHPFREEHIPIIASDQVDPQLGTGVLKITPAHDPTDFVIGEEHNLAFLNVMNEDGTLNDNAGEFRDEHRFAVRTRICDELEKRGLYRGSRDHAMSIPVCGRTGDVVEPLIKEQWFINTEKIGELASQAVIDGDLHIDPEHYSSVWQNYLGKDRNRDWCISRQIWWGHRIPAWWAHRNGDSNDGVWIAAESEDLAREQASQKLGCPGADVQCVQDADVLDTWFSSGIYPFAVFGWPDNTPDLEKFFPLGLMETGHDILFFWVARMVMLSIAVQGKLPFYDVLLHGIICDDQGRKMSKSLGNVIDPLHMIHGCSLDKLKQDLQVAKENGYLSEEEVKLSESELVNKFPAGIPGSGADSLRWALLSYDVKSHQINLDPSLVERAHIWANKIWQVSRLLVQTHEKAELAGLDLGSLPSDFQPDLMDMWILHQLATTVSRVNDEFEERNLDEVVKLIRSFLYSNLCDIYVEYIKHDLRDTNGTRFLPSLMFFHTCLMTGLKLLHPVMPFITEELYHRIPRMPREQRQQSIMIDAYPEATQWNGFLNPDLDTIMTTALTLASGIRSTKTNYNLVKGSRPAVIVHSEDEDDLLHLHKFSSIISRLSSCGEITIVNEKPKLEDLPVGSAINSLDKLTIVVDLGDSLDIEKEKKKLSGKISKLERDIVKLEKSLKGKFQFREKPEVVAEKKEKLNQEIEKLNREINVLSHIKQK